MSTQVGWLPRGEPLACAAVAGCGSVRSRLVADAATRLRAGAALRAIADSEWVVFLGETVDLPWADGAVYLGWEGGLLVPTAVHPTASPDLLRRAIGRPRDEVVVLLPGAILHAPRPAGIADLAALGS